MTMKMRDVVFAGLLCSSVVQAQVVPGTAKDLADGCRIAAAIEDGTADRKYSGADFNQQIIAAGYCYGYINGFMGGYSKGTYGLPSKEICLPAGVTIPQIGRVLARKLEEKPEFEHLQQLPYVVGVMMSTWPCTL